MVAYKGLDGLVLCVIEGKINVERWISSIDMLDHSVQNGERNFAWRLENGMYRMAVGCSKTYSIVYIRRNRKQNI